MASGAVDFNFEIHIASDFEWHDTYDFSGFIEIFNKYNDLSQHAIYKILTIYYRINI